MELIFPFSGAAHQNSFHPLAEGKDLPLPGQEAAGPGERDRSPHCLPSPLLPPGGCAQPCPAWPWFTRGVSPKPQHSGVPAGCLAAPEQLGLQGALEHLDPSQPLMHHHVAQGKSPCNIKIHPKSLWMQIKPITEKNHPWQT